jgi:radical SAM superfamily enzyme YgiQ (UPF0313 family)
VKILLSSICLESGTDIQLALYYLKGYLLYKHSSSRLPYSIQIKSFYEYQDVPYIVRTILRQNARIAGFSCYVWNIEQTLRVCRELKKKDPKLVVVLGGPEVTPRAGEILDKENAIDIVVRGEGEEAFAQCVERIARHGADLSGVKGVSFRHQGRVINNPDRPQMNDLSRIPSPYLSGIMDLRDKNIVDVPLETSRGCVYRCHYCYYHKNFPRVRAFPISRIEKELIVILSRKPREVYLMDATFNSNTVRAKKVLKLFIKYNRGSCLHVELKAELVDDEMAGLLRKAQAFNIEIGIQSTNAKTLKAVNRGFNKKMFERGIGLLNKYGLFYEIQLIGALPYQTYDSLKRSLDWLYGLHPVKVVVFPLAMLPGTTLRQAAGRYGIEYSSRAPYNAYKSNAMSCADVKRVERLRFAMERLYDSQVFQNTLYELKKKAGIRISDVFEDWIEWFSRLPGRHRITPDGLNGRLPVFLKYACRKHGASRPYPYFLQGLLKNLSA